MSEEKDSSRKNSVNNVDTNSENTNTSNENKDCPTDENDQPEENKKDDEVAEKRYEVDPVAEPGPREVTIQSATVWTRKDLKEFKELVKREQPGNMLKIGHGETATVRVPTHKDGARLYWEFATDYYDVGFGLYFEWSVPESDEITVQISESDEEEDDEENDYSGTQAAADGQTTAADIEGRPQRKEKKQVGPHVDEILPTYRKDSHEEVHAGSHPYPGVGVYLLKFDNTYSLWRSKYVYYRVCYGD